MTDIGLMVRSANPVQDDSQQLTDDELSAVLLLAQQRSGDMDTKERTTRAAAPQRRGWAIAAAAFAIVILVVGAVWLVGGPNAGDAPPATTPTSQAVVPSTTEAPTPPTTEAPIEEDASAEVTTTTLPPIDVEAVAFIESIVEDINAGDHSAPSSRIDLVPEINKNGYVPGVEEDDWTPFFQRMFEYWTLVGSRLSIDECGTSETSGVTRCELTRESSEVFASEAERLVVRARVEDGQPTYYEQGPDVVSRFWRDYLAFDEWLYEVTVDDDPAVYRSWFGYASPSDRAAAESEYGPIWVDAGRP